MQRNHESLCNISHASTVSIGSFSSISTETDPADLKYTELRSIAGPSNTQENGSNASVIVAAPSIAEPAEETQHRESIYDTIVNSFSLNNISEHKVRALRNLAQNFVTFTTHAAHQLMEGLFFVCFWVVAMFFMATLHIFSSFYDMSRIPIRGDLAEALSQQQSSRRTAAPGQTSVTRRTAAPRQTSVTRRAASGPPSKPHRMQRAATVDLGRKPRARSASTSTRRRAGSMSPQRRVMTRSSTHIDVTTIKVSPPRKTPTPAPRGRPKNSGSISRIPKARTSRKPTMADDTTVKASGSVPKKSTMTSLPQVVRATAHGISTRPTPKRVTKVSGKSHNVTKQPKATDHAHVVARVSSSSSVYLAACSSTDQHGSHHHGNTSVKIEGTLIG